jgi:prepilin-type N-terminal cleavage/methylation domain-containing protein
MNRQRGFTLIEVLIAATILFMVLAVAGYSYQSSLLASRKAEGLVALLTPLPMILETVRNDLRSHPDAERSGHGTLLGVQYDFEAKTVRYEPPPARFDPDPAVFVKYAPRFRLYDVNLTLKLGGTQRRYLYQELAWEPLRQ